MDIMTAIRSAAQPTETATNSEAIQIVILLGLAAVLIVALASLLSFGALLPPDEPTEQQDRVMRVNGWVLAAVLASQTVISLAGAL